MTRSTAEGQTKLRRTLGLPGLSFFGVGMILGAGIYSVIGAAFALLAAVSVVNVVDLVEASPRRPRGARVSA